MYRVSQQIEHDIASVIWITFSHTCRFLFPKQPQQPKSTSYLTHVHVFATYATYRDDGDGTKCNRQEIKMWSEPGVEPETFRSEYERSNH